MIPRLLALLPFATITGCAADGAYPSLAQRAIEKNGFAEPVRAAAAVVADPALDRKVAELGGHLDAILVGFDRAASDAERKGAAARGRSAGSEPWLEAQTALAALDDWRAQTSALATDVEQLAITRAATLAPAYPGVTALDARIDAELTRQAATIARLARQLAPA